MSRLILFLALAASAVAQISTIGPAVFYGTGLSDVTSGGTFTSVPANTTYRLQVCTAATPDTVKYSKNGGSFSSCVAVTGAALALSDGVTAVFAATTGHTVGDYWLIGVNTHGSAAASTALQPAEGAKMQNLERKVTDSNLSVLDFGADPTGTNDSTAAFTACLKRSYDTGMLCHAPSRVLSIGQPAAIYSVTQVSFPNPGLSNNRSMGLVGESPAYGTTTLAGALQKTGTQILCKQAYGTTGDNTVGCIDAYSSGFNNSKLIFRDLMLRGVDGTGATTKSSNGIMIHGSWVPLVSMSNVQFSGFKGIETKALWVDGPEDSSFIDISAADVYGCFRFSGAANGTVVLNSLCTASAHDGIYVENTQSLVFLGGVCQSVQRTCIHLRGALGVHFYGFHVELVNQAGVAAISPVWVNPTGGHALYTTLPTTSAIAAAGATTLALTGLGSGTIPAGSYFTEGNTGTLLRTTGAVAIVGHAATVGLSTPLVIGIPSGTDISPAATNGEAGILIEAGYTGAGCDFNGLNCGYTGGYNEDNSFHEGTYNVWSGTIREIANAPGANLVQYVNVRNNFDHCAGNPNYFGFFADGDTFSTELTGCFNLKGVLDPALPTNGDRITNSEVYIAPAQTTLTGAHTLLAPLDGNNYVMTFADPDSTYLGKFNWYWDPTAPTVKMIVSGTPDAGVTNTDGIIFDVAQKCVALISGCSGSYEVELGDGGASVVNISASGGHAIYVNGSHVIDSGGHFNGAGVATAGNVDGASFSAGGVGGLTTTKTVRNSAGSGTCTLIFTAGLLTGGTC